MIWFNAQLARGLDPQMPVHHLAVAACQHRNLEAELADAAAHPVNYGFVFAGIASRKGPGGRWGRFGFSSAGAAIFGVCMRKRLHARCEARHRDPP